MIAAALSIQDPRERPGEKEAAGRRGARALRRRGLGLPRLLRCGSTCASSSRSCRAARSGGAARRSSCTCCASASGRTSSSSCAAPRRSAIARNQPPAEPEQIHRALLAGLLSHVGLRDAARPRVHRRARRAVRAVAGLRAGAAAAALGRWRPSSSRPRGCGAARRRGIDPAWIEPIAGHLRQAHATPSRAGTAGAASVVATERVTLYGLPIVEGRTVRTGGSTRALARELFIRRALVERDWDTRHAFFAENGQLLDEVDALEDRVRRRDLASPTRRCSRSSTSASPRTSCPRATSTAGGGTRDGTTRSCSRSRARCCSATRRDVERAARGVEAGRARAAAELPLRARPPEDGVTVHVPLRVLPQLRAGGFDWLVPALRLELVTSLLRALPKEVRRSLAPMPETAAAVLGGADAAARAAPAPGSRARSSGARRPRRGDGVGPVAAGAAPADAIRHRRRRRADRSPRARTSTRCARRCARSCAPSCRARAAGLERRGMRTWEVGELPRVVDAAGHGRRGPRLSGAGRRRGDGRRRGYGNRSGAVGGDGPRDTAPAAADRPGTAAAAGQPAWRSRSPARRMARSMR